jgi:hypothetical protein
MRTSATESRLHTEAAAQFHVIIESSECDPEED